MIGFAVLLTIIPNLVVAAIFWSVCQASTEKSNCCCNKHNLTNCRLSEWRKVSTSLQNNDYPRLILYSEWTNMCHEWNYNLNPEWIAQTPKVKFLYDVQRNPAAFIIDSKSSCFGNFRILSTRYWYGCHCPARTWPIGGMTSKEYLSYILKGSGG